MKPPEHSAQGPHPVAHAPRAARSRLLVRHIWRAFPELDSYSDKECRSFVRIARRRAPWRRVHAMIVGLLFLGGVTAAVWCTVTSARTWLADLPTGGALAADAVIVGGAFGGPALAAYLLRDWLLRRRLRHVLCSSGSCPLCAQSLVGLVIPASLAVTCPECGFLCKVDTALTVLARPTGQGAAQAPAQPGTPPGAAAPPEGLTHWVVMQRPPYWTPERRKLARRTVGAAIVVLLVLTGVPAGYHEYAIRAQAARAKADAPTAVDMSALIARHRPGMRAVEQPAVIGLMHELRLHMASTHATLVPEADSRSHIAGRIDFERIMAHPSTFDERFDERISPAIRQERTEQAFRALAAHEANGLSERLAAIRVAPREVRDLQRDPPDTNGAPLEYLSHARQQTRMLCARLLLAVHNRDTVKAAESLEAIQIIEHTCRDQPSPIEHLVGMVIRAAAAQTVMRWLASEPDAAELDAIGHIWRPADDGHGWQLAIDTQAMDETAILAGVFQDLDAMRHAPFVGITMVAGAPMQTPIRNPGSWEVNRDAIEARRQYDMLHANRTPQDAARDALTAQPPAYKGAALAERVSALHPTSVLANPHATTHDQVIATMVALARWRLQHGAYPDSLDVLVPTLLHTVPIDVWSGAPLGYRRTNPAQDPYQRPYILYSFGPDGQDNLGVEVPADATGFPRPRGHPRDTPWGHDAQLNTAYPVPRASAPK